MYGDDLAYNRVRFIIELSSKRVLTFITEYDSKIETDWDYEIKNGFLKIFNHRGKEIIFNLNHIIMIIDNRKNDNRKIYDDLIPFACVEINDKDI